ncbi:hypothetical protein ABG067_004238 [Albugo candida]
MLHNEKVRSGGQNAPEIAAYNQHLSEFLQHRTYYLPILPSESHLSPNQNSDATELSHISITNTIRKEFRKQSSAPDAIDTAFLALRSLNEQLEVAKRYGFHPAPTKCVERSCEISGVRHAATLDTGTFLLAHPLLDGIFSRSVILITQHSLHKGTRGLIVNLLSSDSVARTFKVSLDVSSAFGSNPVFCGGPVSSRHAEILHGKSGIGGIDIKSVADTAVDSQCDAINQVFWGGDLEAAARATPKEEAKASEVVFFKGVSVWIPGQLENELRRGTWIPVSAPVRIALNADRQLWSSMLKALGGEFGEWAQLPELQ